MRENVIVCFVLLRKLDASLSRENINGKSKTSRNRKASFSFYQSRKLTHWKYSEIDESSADLIWKTIRCFTEIGKKTTALTTTKTATARASLMQSTGFLAQIISI